MSVLIVDPVQQTERLTRVGQTFQLYVEESHQVLIDKLLDSINGVKEGVARSIKVSRKLEDDLRGLFDLTNLSEEQLASLKSTLDSIEEELPTMRSNYIKGRRLYDKYKLAKGPLKEYGEVTNDLKELVTDLRDRFFILPQDDEFTDLMQQLSEIA